MTLALASKVSGLRLGLDEFYPWPRPQRSQTLAFTLKNSGLGLEPISAYIASPYMCCLFTQM